MRTWLKCLGLVALTLSTITLMEWLDPLEAQSKPEWVYRVCPPKRYNDSITQQVDCVNQILNTLTTDRAADAKVVTLVSGGSINFTSLVVWYRK